MELRRPEQVKTFLSKGNFFNFWQIIKKNVYNFQVNVTSRKVISVSDTSGLSSPQSLIEIEDLDKTETANTRNKVEERNARTPQAAPRNLKKNLSSIPEVPASNLEADIEEILNIT